MAASHYLKMAAVLLVTMVTCAQGSQCNLVCPQSSGYFGHPQSCISYVKCVGGRAYHEKCPANLHYNTGLGQCDFPKNAMCNEAEKEQSTSCELSQAPKLRNSPVPGISCDCGECCRKPHPLDCTSFFECDENADAYKKTCSEGLVYNPVIEDCDLPTNYECPKLLTCNCKCRYPVKGECDAFYRCKEIGETVTKEYCTEGLIFNAETEMCDFPSNSDCPPSPHPTIAPEECKDYKTDCKIWAANGNCVCNPEKNGDCSWQNYVKNNCPNSCSDCAGSIPNPPTDKPNPSTSPPKPDVTQGSSDGIIDGCLINCELGQYYPHPTNCAMFIQCAPYGPQEMPCAPGTLWDQELLTCNHASVTECVTGKYTDVNGNECGGDSEVQPPNPVPSEPPAPKPTSPPKPDVTQGSSDGIIDGCLINCELGQYYPHPTNCAMFIQCAPYGPQEMPCAPGTLWDQELLTCNHASVTECVTGKYTDANGNECGGDSEVQPPNPAPSEPPAPKPTSPPKPDVTQGSSDGIIDGCLINCELGQYYPHPTNCAMFIQCAPYGPQEMPCAPGTLWDQELLTCNHASVTECVTGKYTDANGNECGGGSEVQSPNPHPNTPPVPKPTNPQPDVSPKPPGPDCEIDCSKGQYHRHPTDCKKFIQCTPYGPQEMPCAEGTRWDQNILTCNHESVTPCVVGNGDCETTVPDEPAGECDIVCPQPNGVFAHPRNCRYWVHCSNNIPYVKECPAHLIFDPTKKVCNWPKNTVCIAEEDSECAVPIIPTPTPAPNATEIIPPEVCDCECCLRPHPDDCQSYYYCDGSNTEFHTCSEGLVFHPENETCVFAKDYPECNIIVPPVCECECLYPSPVCTEYFKCVDNVPEKLECPNGLFFNPNSHACDHPQNVDCTPAPMRRFAGRIPTPISASDCKRLPDGRYPVKNSQAEFYHCARGVSFLLKCQEGTTFNAKLTKCARK